MSEPSSDKQQRGADKMARIPIKIIPTTPETRKRIPSWIRVKAPTDARVKELKDLLRQNRMHTVCEEANCPNLNECFSHGTATFMIMGDTCTRRCTFCDVKHGRPDSLDIHEPANLANSLKIMNLKYVVITSVDRDDLKDGGAGHFVACIQAAREACPTLKIEVLVPDFRGRMDIALDILQNGLPDVFNHNIETVPRLYKQVRPGSDYQWSLNLIKKFKARFPHIPTKSGIMLGLGETLEEIYQVFRDLRAHDCDMLTVGQYLQPSAFHHPIEKYWTPEEFETIGAYARTLGFTNVASGPMVRSSYHADRQAAGDSLTS